MTDLPFVFVDAVYHIGAPLPLGAGFTPRGVKLWDFEFGLLSVSLNPEAWRHGWAGPAGVIHQITSDRPLCFIDADLTLTHARPDLEKAAVRLGLVTQTSAGFIATDLLYARLRLTPNSMVSLAGRPDGDQVLQAALAVLISLNGADCRVDGLWWSDTLGSGMRTERGGIFQHKLASFHVDVVVAPAPVGSPAATWQPTSII